MSDEVWKKYTHKLAPVTSKRIKARTVKPAPDKSALDKNISRKAAITAPTSFPKIDARSGLDNTVGNALERSREKAIRGGSIDIDAKLDLHGLTQVEAFDALTHFMQRAVKGGKRHLLIVTGKGREGKGVLRSNLQQWLGQLPEAGRVLAIRSAATKHGGTGAWYVILRKK